MKMSPNILIIGGLLAWAASVSLMVIMPVINIKDAPSDIWRPMTEMEQAGHKLYVSNGCSYCHSLYIRPIDWGLGASRIAEMGDYYGQQPAILGSIRTGPDLSQAGGEHPNDWHLAHFINPRYTSPISLMPSWEFLGLEKISELTAYVQYLGLKQADTRVARQEFWQEKSKRAYELGPDANIDWIHSMVPREWREMPNPYPATEDALMRGENIYQKFCIGCHGPVGDGRGEAHPYIYPPPLNFTTLRRNLVNDKYIGGIFYYQIMNGITGTAMPYFKKALESEKIWDVGNYVAVYFMGYSDANTEPRGIDAAYEPDWENPFEIPDSTGSPKFTK